MEQPEGQIQGINYIFAFKMVMESSVGFFCFFVCFFKLLDFNFSGHKFNQTKTFSVTM